MFKSVHTIHTIKLSIQWKITFARKHFWRWGMLNIRTRLKNHPKKYVIFCWMKYWDVLQSLYQRFSNCAPPSPRAPQEWSRGPHLNYNKLNSKHYYQLLMCYIYTSIIYDCTRAYDMRALIFFRQTKYWRTDKWEK